MNSNLAPEVIIVGSGAGGGSPICPEEHFNVGGKTKWYGAAVLSYSHSEFLPDATYAARERDTGSTSH